MGVSMQWGAIAHLFLSGCAGGGGVNGGLMKRQRGWTEVTGSLPTTLTFLNRQSRKHHGVFG